MTNEEICIAVNEVRMLLKVRDDKSVLDKFHVELNKFADEAGN